MEPETLAKILELSRKMAENRELNSMLHYAMQEAVKLVKAEYGYLLLLREDGSFEFRVSLHRDGRTVPDTNERVSTTILHEVMESQREKLVIDALDEYGTAGSVNRLRLRSVMCAPLISKGSIIGALYMENREGAAIFKRDDLVPLNIFANQAAVLIENALLNETLEQRVEARTYDLNEALQQLEKSWQQVIEANELRTNFLANLTHDMRTPLSVAIGAVALLRDGSMGEISAHQDEWLGKIHDALSHVTELTEDLFTLASSESRNLLNSSGDMGMLISREYTAIKPFLERLYHVGAALPWQQQVRFQLRLPEKLPTLLMDELRVRQVIFNLLSNALRFTEEGSVTLYAETLPKSQELLIGVEDTGVGLRPEDNEVIFERFQAANNHSQARHQGTGLGLAICRELVTLHGGRIWVESSEQGGCDFRFTLPLETP